MNPIEMDFVSGFQIKRPVNTSDGAGSYTSAAPTLVLTTSGRMRQLSGNEISSNEKRGQKTTHRFYCPVVNIDFLDLILNPKTGKYYEVKVMNNPMDADEFLQIDCEYKEEYQP